MKNEVIKPENFPKTLENAETCVISTLLNAFCDLHLL